MNPRGVCAANEAIVNEKRALTWHADDAKSVHVSPKVNNEFANWCEEKCASDDLSHVKVTREKRHDHLGMALDCFKSKAALIDMIDHVDQMKEDFLEKLEKKTKAWSDKLLTVDKNSKRLCNEK